MSEPIVENFFSANALLEDCFRKILAKDAEFYIYGSSFLERHVFFLLWRNGITPDGLVARPGEEQSVGDSFMGKQILCKEEFRRQTNKQKFLCDFSNMVIYDADGGIVSADIDTGSTFCVYGAGHKGELFRRFAEENGVHIKCYVDRSPTKQMGHMGQYKIVPPKEINDVLKSNHCHLVVALGEDVCKQVARQLAEQHGIEKVYVYDISLFFELLNMKVVNGNVETSTSKLIGSVKAFSPALLYYLRFIVDKKKKLIIWGSKKRVQVLIERLSSIHIQAAYGIADDNSDAKGLFRDCYDLAYEKPEDTVVLVLFGSKERAIEFLKESGLPETMFCCNEQNAQPEPLLRTTALDPTMGFSIRYGEERGILLYTPKWKTGQTRLRIGVLGGSTTEGSYSREKSWPEQLMEVAVQHNVVLEVFDAAVSGYSVGNEVLKYVRDMSHLNLDMLISYSRVNEGDNACDQHNHFLQPYQLRLFDYLSYSIKKDKLKDDMNIKSDVIFANGIQDRGEHWLHCEKMLFGICHEFGISFRAVIQPYIKNKKENRAERECFMHANFSENIWNDFHGRMENISSHVLSKLDEYPWLVDGTHIFDDVSEPVFLDYCHVNNRGNRLIAEWMFRMIRDALCICDE